MEDHENKYLNHLLILISFKILYIWLYGASLYLTCSNNSWALLLRATNTGVGIEPVIGRVGETGSLSRWNSILFLEVCTVSKDNLLSNCGNKFLFPLCLADIYDNSLLKTDNFLKYVSLLLFFLPLSPFGIINSRWASFLSWIEDDDA